MHSAAMQCRYIFFVSLKLKDVKFIRVIIKSSSIVSIATADKHAHASHAKNPLKRFLLHRFNFIDGNWAKVHRIFAFFLINILLIFRDGWSIAYKRINKYYEPPFCSRSHCGCIRFGLNTLKKIKYYSAPKQRWTTVNMPTYLFGIRWRCKIETILI